MRSAETAKEKIYIKKGGYLPYISDATRRSSIIKQWQRNIHAITAELPSDLSRPHTARL